MASAPQFVREYPNLASASLGAEVVAVSDDFFAAASRMLADSAPVFIADKYDAHGKWMDGWETRRSRSGKNDWCVVRLAANTRICGLLVDTRHFTGNYPQAAGVDFCSDPGEMKPGKNSTWLPLLVKEKLGPDGSHYFSARDFVLQPHRVRYLRLNIYPNGGIARFRVFGEAQDAPPQNENGEWEVSSLLCGGRVVDWNNSHFGEPWVILKPDRAKSMQDGWETRRRREGEYDWLLMRLPRPAIVRGIEVDTAYFKGNFPDSCSLEAGYVIPPSRKWQNFLAKASNAIPPPSKWKKFFPQPDDGKTPSYKWKTLLPKTPLSAHKRHFYADEVCPLPPVEMVRLRIYPDGGVSRLRLFGDFAKQ
ncbi:MAG: allantoicase [Gammaproteobacteria bacterium]